jgi:aminoglycoside phosphotransferase (APT) family kinase protein
VNEGREARAGLDFAGVVERVAPGSVLLRVWPMTGGSSAAMTGLQIRGADGRIDRLVVRRFGRGDLEANRLAVSDEARLLQGLGQAGLAVPAVRGVDASGRMLGEPYLVLAYVEGEAEFAPGDLDGYLGHMAGQLAAIHGVDVVGMGLGFLPRQAGVCVELGNGANFQFASQAGGMRYGAEAGGMSYGAETGDGSCGAEVEGMSNEGILRAMVEAGPGARRNRVRLLHGDFWPGNVLWRAGRPAAVIDWEDAMIGDPLLDLAIARLDMAWIFGRPAMETFTERYRALTAVDVSALPYWDLCAALRLARLVGGDLAGWVGFFAPFGRGDISEAGFRADFAAFVGRAIGRL